jgi:hypothetical protein
MANPTTNYGFVLPTPTDLVTDLPADFDVALQGVDTRLKALNPSTTLGDIDYASATANTNTRLGIGTTGQVLTVTGGVPAWSTISAGGMTQIATGSLSGASVTISSIAGTYKNLVLLIDNTRVASQPFIGLRFNADATSTAYRSGYTSSDSSATTSGAGASYGRIANGTSDGANEYERVVVNIPFYAVSDGYKVFDALQSSWASQSTSPFTFLHYGAWKNSAAITSITILTSDGTSFLGGTYTLYGVS